MNDNLTASELAELQAAIEDLTPTEHRFPDFDPYAKAEPPSDDRQRDFWFGEDSRIRVTNLSAFWLPELALKKEIGGTVYSVSGSYEGTEALDRKLERILENNLENMEDSE